MGNRDEDQRVGLALAGFTLAVFLALMGALFLPQGVISGWFTGRWAPLMMPVLALAGIPILVNLSQRSRIRRAVARSQTQASGSNHAHTLNAFDCPEAPTSAGRAERPSSWAAKPR